MVRGWVLEMDLEKDQGMDRAMDQEMVRQFRLLGNRWWLMELGWVLEKVLGWVPEMVPEMVWGKVRGTGLVMGQGMEQAFQLLGNRWWLMERDLVQEMGPDLVQEMGQEMGLGLVQEMDQGMGLATGLVKDLGTEQMFPLLVNQWWSMELDWVRDLVQAKVPERGQGWDQEKVRVWVPRWGRN